MFSGVRLQHFRSYEDDVFEFGNGVNIIVGPNASGKTNLLEAILVLCRGSSYRVKDLDLVSFDQPWARLEGEMTDGKRVVTLERTDHRADKKYLINDTKFSRLPLQKSIPVVVFEPDHLQLLSRGPEMRRDYIDNLLEQTVTGFAKLRRQYKRTLAQRNNLLKSQAQDQDFFVWNIQLSELGGQLVKYRLDLIDKLNAKIELIYRELSQSESTIKVNYLSKCSLKTYGTSLLHKLESSLYDDQARGFTGSGPHRDDLEVEINGQPAGVSASRGESRTILLALKIMELELLEQARDKKPVLLLDDVFSELDGSRRKALTTYLKDCQTFITTTDADIVVQHFMDKCTILPLGKNS